MDNDLRKELFAQYLDYFHILDKLGKGIMIKPHLQQYMLKLNNINKYKFNRDLDRLHDVRLIEIMKTKSVTIIRLTKQAIMFLKNKKTIKEVSSTTITTNKNLKMSLVKNEYIINTYLDKYCSMLEFMAALEETNLIAKTGDNEKLMKKILKKYNYNGKIKDHDLKNLLEEIEYINDAKHNKELQIQKVEFDAQGNEIPKIKKQINFTGISINNLQARHIYVKSIGEIYSKNKDTESPDWVSDIQLSYIEISNLMTYEKFKRDLDVISKWLLGSIRFGEVTIEVVIEPNRRSAIEHTIKKWNINRLSQFCKPNVMFKIIEIDVTNKYLKGVNISI